MDNCFPSEIKAGLTFDLTMLRAAYPAPDWAFAAHLRGPSSINLTAAPDGEGHKFTETAANTANWAAGRYWYSIRATKGDEVREVENGEVTITANLQSAAAGYDGRTHAQICLDNIEAVLEKRATKDQQKYTINNRELWRTPLGDLLALRDHYKAEVAREQATQSGRAIFGRQVRVRFGHVR